MSNQNRTTIIVGAGASVDLGLPTGNQLITTITRLADTLAKDRLSVGDQFEHELRSAAIELFKGHDARQRLQSYARRIRSSLWLAASIDNYINEQADPELARLGKFLIVASIIFHERKSFPVGAKQTFDRTAPNRLWDALGKDGQRRGFEYLRETWLVPFFRTLRGKVSFDQFKSRLESLTLVVFNYDRSIEFFLYHAIRNYDDLSHDQACELIAKVDIIHPYSFAAPLPWQYGGGLDNGDLESPDLAGILLRDDSIRTFGEAEAARRREDAQKAILHSRSVAFIGFGFLDINLNYLGQGQDLRFGNGGRRRVYATTFGLSDFRENNVRTQLRAFSNAATNGNLYIDKDISLIKGTGSDLIEEYGDFLFS